MAHIILINKQGEEVVHNVAQNSLEDAVNNSFKKSLNEMYFKAANVFLNDEIITKEPKKFTITKSRCLH